MKHHKIYSIRTAQRCETHISLRPSEACYSIGAQLDDLLEAYLRLLAELELSDADIFLAKAFASDLINQNDSLRAHPLFAQHLQKAALSIVEQPPLDGSKINLLLWLIQSPQRHSFRIDQAICTTIGEHTHVFHSISPPAATADQVEQQTFEAFAEHDRLLKQLNMNLANDCMRTWIYVKDIDCDYGAMVGGRNRYFKAHNLSPDTHFIASTGIGGGGDAAGKRLGFDFYAVGSLPPAAVQYLHAPTHLNPTHQYGVAFERGVRIGYADISHIFISGTASINNRGECINSGNTIRQLDRVFENIDNLLRDASANLSHIASMTIYLRDIADASIARNYIDNRFPTVPALIVLARVCRPQWLVEVECIAAILPN
ncbi:MAG: hypothetical protein LBD28_03285 [Tannerellaceae bacterium]|jgi:enamine deaminase RidA (YjgF/YER057c/UK114 family)|nr:hypothetical protein [Tannerellaceae bacterium]